MGVNREHEELHAVIYKYFGPSLAINCYKSPDQQDHELTDAILAAGYRKPRTITNEEEIAGLPTGAVLLSDEGGIWHAYDHLGWREPGRTLAVSDYDIALPATVLFEPGVSDGC